jgi:hypothetical protein
MQREPMFARGTSKPVGAYFTNGQRSFMSKETAKDDPRRQSDDASLKQTDKPWEGNPEKEQRNEDTKIDLEKWHETKTH